ncbi:MAG TPA: DUF3332 domain-containing protein [Flavobacteriales bacterium]|nr:DUF3332 domain-containing protein [Flavobacteriales bacterium]
MKIIRKTAFVLALGSLTITQTGCFGEFALVRKVYNWNQDIGGKFVNTLVFYALNIIPVYGIASLVDFVILNLIEFWSGSNPVSMKEGDYEMQLTTIDGVDYKIEATKDTFTTTQLSGEKAGEVRVMKFDRTNKTWKYTDSEVCDQPVMTFLDDQADAIRVYTEKGAVDLTSEEMNDQTALDAKFASCGYEALASH